MESKSPISFEDVKKDRDAEQKLLEMIFGEAFAKAPLEAIVNSSCPVIPFKKQ